MGRAYIGYAELYLQLRDNMSLPFHILCSSRKPLKEMLVQDNYKRCWQFSSGEVVSMIYVIFIWIILNQLLFYANTEPLIICEGFFLSSAVYSA